MEMGSFEMKTSMTGLQVSPEGTALARPHQADGAGESGAGTTHRVPNVSDHVVEGEPADDPGAVPVGQRVDADHVIAVPADRVQEGAVEQGVGHGARDEHDRRRRARACA